MAKNSPQKKQKNSNKNSTGKSAGTPSTKPSQCGICQKSHHGECWFADQSAPSRSTATCDHCGIKGHETSACYKKTPNQRRNKHSSTPVAEGVKTTQRWSKILNCQRERDQSEVTFPLFLVGRSSTDLAPRFDAWLEDYQNDVVMCLHDCRGDFCFKLFANKCAKQLRRGKIVISQKDEEAIWKALRSNGVPTVGYGEKTGMDVDEDEVL